MTKKSKSQKKLSPKQFSNKVWEEMIEIQNCIEQLRDRLYKIENLVDVYTMNEINERTKNER